MEQLPLTTNGLGISLDNAGATTAPAPGQSNLPQNTVSFSDIAKGLVAEQIQSQQTKVGLAVALAKITGNQTAPTGKDPVLPLPPSGNILPYGQDALELNPVINVNEPTADTDIEIANLPVTDVAQSRLQQLIQSNKLTSIQTSLKPETVNPSDVAKPDLKLDLDDLKQLDLSDKQTPKTSMVDLIQNQKMMFKPEPISHVVSDVVKRLVGDSAKNSLATDTATSIKSTSVDSNLSAQSFSNVIKSDTTGINATPVVKVPQPMNHPQWGNELANRVVIVAKQNIHEAQIKINPANLGPIELRVSVNNDQASVSFISHHAPVRDALEAAIPKLREMFEQSGFGSLDVDIKNQHHAKHSDHSNQRIPGGPSLVSGLDDEFVEPEMHSTRNNANTLIDYFA